MTDIIKEMAQLAITDDFINDINVYDLIKRFKENHKKLDEFKDIKDEYEKRGKAKKLLDFITFDSTLEDAQLDATEVQAEFSKILGELTVVNIMLSKHLNAQQNQLSSQQSTIKEQTQQIEFQTNRIEDQQDELSKQNAELDKLVKEYFELKGLTQEGAKKLIAIAQKIQHTEEELLSSVEHTKEEVLRSVEHTKKELLSSVDDSIHTLTEWIKKENNHLINKTTELKNEVNQELIKFQNLMSESEQESLRKFENISSQFDTKIIKLTDATSNDLKNMNNKYQLLFTQHEERQIENKNNINILQNSMDETYAKFDAVINELKQSICCNEQKHKKMVITFSCITGLLTIAIGCMFLLPH